MTDAALSMDTDAAVQAVAEALKTRSVVPYVGPGAFRLIPEEACKIPRDSAELAKRLNAKVAAPGRIRANLTQVAQFIETRRHRKTLDALMTELFRPDVPPTPVHRFVASLPAPPLVVDVWYDTVLEQLLSDAADRTWGQIQGVSHPQGAGEWTRCYGPDGSPLAADAAAAWDTVVYKPAGGVSPAGNFVISDSDFVELLTEIDIQSPIPDVVKDRRSGRSFLFLGCRFDHEIQRTFAKQISKRSADRHWAVIDGELTKNEARFLDRQGVIRIDLPLDEAVRRLEAALAA